VDTVVDRGVENNRVLWTTWRRTTRHVSSADDPAPDRLLHHPRHTRYAQREITGSELYVAEPIESGCFRAQVHDLVPIAGGSSVVDDGLVVLSEMVADVAETVQSGASARRAPGT
jgi:hypothetical protein